MASFTRRTLILVVGFVCTFGVASFASANIVSELQRQTYTATYSLKAGGLNRSYEVIGPVAALPDSAPIIGCCGQAAQRNVDDVAFMKALVATVDYGHKHPIYVVGYSNGGRLAYKLACSAPGLFDGTAVVKADPDPGLSRPGMAGKDLGVACVALRVFTEGTHMSSTDLKEPVPAELRTAEFVLRPIVADDAELDYAAVMETRDYLRLWRQSTWPEDDFTVEENRKDLVECEERHLAGRAFTYTVLDPGGTECLGCVYVFPTRATFLARAAVTRVGDDEWADVEAVVFFWARLSQMEARTDERLLAALRAWFTEEWKLTRTVYVTSEPFTQQVDLLGRTDMKVKFELQEPDKPRKRLVFG